MQYSTTLNRDRVAGIATRYGLDSPGIGFRWGRDFPQSSKPALGPTLLLVECVPGLFPAGVKRPGRGVNHPHPSRAEVKEIVEL
jgi:hypothetical protein